MDASIQRAHRSVGGLIKRIKNKDVGVRAPLKQKIKAGSRGTSADIVKLYIYE